MSDFEFGVIVGVFVGTVAAVFSYAAATWVMRQIGLERAWRETR